MTPKALQLVRSKLKKEQQERAAKIRTFIYGVVLDKPRLEHVYKDRSWKSALAMDLKVSGSNSKESHWCWDKQQTKKR